jgi:hypothetical protein
MLPLHFLFFIVIFLLLKKKKKKKKKKRTDKLASCFPEIYMGCQKSHGYVGTKEVFSPATWLYLINRPVNISVLVWVSPTVPLPWETIFPHRRFHLLFIILFPSLPFLFWVLWEPEYKCFFFFFSFFFFFFTGDKSSNHVGPHTCMYMVVNL